MPSARVNQGIKGTFVTSAVFNSGDGPKAVQPLSAPAHQCG